MRPRCLVRSQWIAEPRRLMAGGDRDGRANDEIFVLREAGSGVRALLVPSRLDLGFETQFCCQRHERHQ